MERDSGQNICLAPFERDSSQAHPVSAEVSSRRDEGGIKSLRFQRYPAGAWAAVGRSCTQRPRLRLKQRCPNVAVASALTQQAGNWPNERKDAPAITWWTSEGPRSPYPLPIRSTPLSGGSVSHSRSTRRSCRRTRTHRRKGGARGSRCSMLLKPRHPRLHSWPRRCKSRALHW